MLNLLIPWFQKCAPMNCNYCLHFTMKRKTENRHGRHAGLSNVWSFSVSFVFICPQFSPQIENNIKSNQWKYNKNNLLLMNVYKCFICRVISLFVFSRVAVIRTTTRLFKQQQNLTWHQMKRVCFFIGWKMLKLTFHSLATLPADNSCCLRGLEGKTVILVDFS